jgi:hypothetical protein
MTEFSMLARILLALLLVSSAPALAAEGTKEPSAPATQAAKGPVMGELLRLPKYIYAWQGMMAGETPPQWVKDYALTLDGPPVPTIPVPLDGEIYTLGFTCKPNDCETHQLFVLFAPEGRDAWGLLASPNGVSWLGKPDKRIQKAIDGALRK